MNDHEMTMLLERAGSGLDPDVAELVARGATRGRALQRRRRAGIAVAALAVAGAALVPVLALGGGSPEKVAPAGEGDGRAIAVPLEEMGTVLASLVPGSHVVENPEPFEYEVRAGTVRWRGDDITMSIDSSGTNNPSTPDVRCRAYIGAGGPDCTQLPDGSWTVSHTLVSGRVGGPGTDLETAALEVRVYTPDGYLLRASDAAPYLDDGTTTHELDAGDLLDIAVDGVWFN